MATPILSAATRTVDGFTFEITNFGSYNAADGYQWTVRVTDGVVSRTDEEVVVTGLDPDSSATVTVSVDASGMSTGVARITATSQRGAAVNPELSALTSRTTDGFTFNITNYSSLYTYFAQTTSGTVSVSSTGVVTVTGLTPGGSATVTVSAGRGGYAEGVATRDGTTSLGRALVPVFGLAEAAANGFAVPVTNYVIDDEAVTWTAESTAGAASLSGGVVTVSGLAAGQTATITVSTEHANRENGSASFTFAALGADGATPGVTRGLAPTFGAVTRTLDGFTVPITNFNSQYTWSTVRAVDVRVNGTRVEAVVNTTTGVLTVTGLSAGQTDDVVVVTNRAGYGTGNARVTASALSAGTRERNLLTDAAVGPICSTGSPEGYEVGKVNDLAATSTYACFVNDARNIGTYTANSIGFYTGDLSSVVIDRITFTSSQSNVEHDPVTYSLWGCAEENRFCSAIVSNDITNLSTDRGANSTRTIRNTRAFRYYRLMFGSVRGTTHSVNIGEVSFGGRSAEQAALTPSLGTATVNASGLQVQVNNYSSLYSWNVSVPSPGVANISTSGVITISNLAPTSASTLTVTATRPGYATGTTSYSFTTTSGPELRPVLSRPVLTADGARVRIENFNTAGYEWLATEGDCSEWEEGDPTIPITANGLMLVTGKAADSSVTLSVCTERTNYQDGKSEVTFTVPSAGYVAQFDAPTRTDDGFNVQIREFSTDYSWSVKASNGASVLLENSGLIRVSNLGAGQSSTVTVTASRTGYSNGVAQVTSSAIDAGLTPQFSETRPVNGGYEFTITNYDTAFTWAVTENNGANTTVSAQGVVTVTTGTPSTSYVTVTTTRTNYQSGTATIGAGLNPALVPAFDDDSVTATETTATVEIANFDSSYVWSASVVPSGRVVIDENGVVMVSGASPGSDVTVVVTSTRNGYATGRTSYVLQTAEREGLAPALAAPIRLVGGFSVDITNFDAQYTWAATTTAGTAVVNGDNVLVTGLAPAESATVTVTTSRSGYARGSTDVTSSALLSPAVVPQFGAPTSTLGGFTTQITNYDAALTWTASASAGGTATISETGLVTVSGLPGLTTAELVVVTESPTHVTGRAATTGTSLVNPALTPRFGLTESTLDGIRVRIANYDPRWTWSTTVSGVDTSQVSIGQDGFITVSGVTGVRYITLTVKSERAGFISGSAEVSAYSLPEPRITLGAQSVTRFEVNGSGQAILTTSSAHGFRVGDVVVVTGVSAQLDGERTVTAITTSVPHTMSFATNVAITPATDLNPSGSVRLLDDINLEVLMTNSDAPIVVRAQINIPYSVADSGTQFTATTMMSEVIDAGYRVVRVRAESETEGRISELNVPIRILFDPPAEGAVPVYSGDGGETWRILELLDTPFLPDDREDGYFVSADGRVWVFTRHLSIFGLLARQAVPITVSSTANSMIVGDVGSISVSGGEGEGEVTSRVLTPDVCSLSDSGDVTALRAGDCVVEGKKAAFDRFVEATGTLTIPVSDPPVEPAPAVIDTPTADTDSGDVVAETPKKKTKKSTSSAVNGGAGVGGDDSVDDGVDENSNDGGTSVTDGENDIDKGTADDQDTGDGRNFSMRWVVFGVLGLLILLGVIGISLRLRRRTL